MKNVLASGVCLGDVGVLKEFLGAYHVYEGVCHLETSHTDSLQHRRLLLLILQVNSPCKYWRVCLVLLDVNAQVDNEAEYLVVAVVNARDQGRHTLIVLNLEHLENFLTQVSLYIINLYVSNDCVHLLGVLVIP